MEDGVQKTAPAHKAILASCSEYFRAMFTNKMKPVDHLEIKNSSIFHFLIKHMYMDAPGLIMPYGHFKDVVEAIDIFNISTEKYTNACFKEWACNYIDLYHKDLISGVELDYLWQRAKPETQTKIAKYLEEEVELDESYLEHPVFNMFSVKCKLENLQKWGKLSLIDKMGIKDVPLSFVMENMKLTDFQLSKILKKDGITINTLDPLVIYWKHEVGRVIEIDEKDTCHCKFQSTVDAALGKLPKLISTSKEGCHLLSVKRNGEDVTHIYDGLEYDIVCTMNFHVNERVFFTDEI
jgi:hypothetical protein